MMLIVNLKQQFKYGINFVYCQYKFFFTWADLDEWYIITFQLLNSLFVHESYIYTC
mgnify:CR=1 FL=1